MGSLAPTQHWQKSPVAFSLWSGLPRWFYWDVCQLSRDGWTLGIAGPSLLPQIVSALSFGLWKRVARLFTWWLKALWTWVFRNLGKFLRHKTSLWLSLCKPQSKRHSSHVTLVKQVSDQSIFKAELDSYPLCGRSDNKFEVIFNSLKLC